jgi:hypothetical protein
MNVRISGQADTVRQSSAGGDSSSRDLASYGVPMETLLACWMRLEEEVKASLKELEQYVQFKSVPQLTVAELLEEASRLINCQSQAAAWRMLSCQAQHRSSESLGEFKIHASVPSQSFFGRERELYAIAEGLAVPCAKRTSTPLHCNPMDLLKDAKGHLGSCLPVVVCHGLDGMGKTQLLLQFAHKTASAFTRIIWIQATHSQPQRLHQDFAALAVSLGYSSNLAQTPLEFMRFWLQQNPGWLLIIDDLDTAATVVDLLPPKGGGVLISSSRSDWPLSWRSVHLDKMLLEESSTLLRSYITEPVNLIPLAELLGHVPLALAQAGAYIRACQTSCTVAEYMGMYEAHSISFLKDASQLASISATKIKPLAATWTIVLETVFKLNPSSIELLRVCTHLAADCIPKTLLFRWWQSTFHPGDSQLVAFYESLAILLKYSLLRVTAPGLLSIHRTLQIVARNYLASPHMLPGPDWSQALANVLLDQFWKAEGDSVFPEEGQRFFFPHLQALRHHFEDGDETAIPCLSLARITYAIGVVHLYYHCQFKAAKVAFETV